MDQTKLQHTQVHSPTGGAFSLVLSFRREGKDVDGVALHLCRFQTEMKMSAPLPMGYPAGSPFSGAGSTSSASDLLIRIGGWGYMRRDSARAALTYGIFLMSSRSARPLARYVSPHAKGAAENCLREGITVPIIGGCHRMSASSRTQPTFL